MERSTKRKPRLADLASYRRQGGRVCGVCASPHRKFIERAFAAGHSKPAIRRYFAEELGVQLPFIGYHLLNHVDKKA